MPGADLIITASDFKDNLVEIANEYPDLATVILNENVLDQAENGNMYGVDFSVSEASFLAGIAAADVASSGVEGHKRCKDCGLYRRYGRDCSHPGVLRWLHSGCEIFRS